MGDNLALIERHYQAGSTSSDIGFWLQDGVIYLSQHTIDPLRMRLILPPNYYNSNTELCEASPQFIAKLRW